MSGLQRSSRQMAVTEHDLYIIFANNASSIDRVWYWCLNLSHVPTAAFGIVGATVELFYV